VRVRKIHFTNTAEDREKFSLLYQGFLTGGNMAQSKGMEITRREARVLDKLDSISEDSGGEKCATCGTATMNKREMIAADHTLELEPPDFDLLKKYFEATPWTVRVAKRVVDISDWLGSIPLEGG